jgi:hypothetical protein
LLRCAYPDVCDCGFHAIGPYLKHPDER